MGKDKNTFLNEFYDLHNSLELEGAIKDKNAAILAGITTEGDAKKAAVTAAFFSEEKKETLTEQFKSLIKAPKNNTKDEILYWVTKNKDAFALLSNSDICDNIDDKDFQSYREKLAEPVKIIQDWIDLHFEYGDYLLSENGGYRNLSKYAEDTEYGKANKALNTSRMDFGLFISSALAKDMISELTPQNDAGFIRSLTYAPKDSKRVGNFIVVYHIAQRHPNEPELIGKCREAAEKLTETYKEDPLFCAFTSGNSYKSMMEGINTAEAQAKENYKKKAEEKKAADAKIKKNNEEAAKREKAASDKQTFKDFADDLVNAAKSTYRDSSEYKEIIGWTNFLRDGADFSSDKFPKETREQWANMTDKQKEALPLYILHNSLEKYLEHKAKDGVKRNTYDKLAVVEKMYQYISKRIKEIAPGDFKFSIKGEKYDFKQANVHGEYAEEFSAEHSNNNSFIDIDSSTGVYSRIKFKDSLLGKAGIKARDKGFDIDWEELDNVESCMNRIMLKAQKAQIRKKPDISRKSLAHSFYDMYETKLSFYNDPVRPFKKSLEAKHEEHNMTR